MLLRNQCLLQIIILCLVTSLLALSAQSDDLSIKRQVRSAYSLSDQAKGKFSYYYGTHGTFLDVDDKSIHKIELDLNQFLESVNVDYSADGNQIFIDYTFGKAASPKLTGKGFQIIGSAEDVGLVFSCTSDKKTVLENLPTICFERTPTPEEILDEYKILRAELAEEKPEIAAIIPSIEAFSLSYEGRTELSRFFNNNGNFHGVEDLLIDMPGGNYNEPGVIVLSENNKQVMIEYRFGRAALERSIGKYIQIIGDGSSGELKWSCHSNDRIVAEKNPDCS